MSCVVSAAEYLLANPIVLFPLLLIVAAVVWAVIKRLLKLAAIVAIAGILYLVLVEFVGGAGG
jgi:hypothetical protein